MGFYDLGEPRGNSQHQRLHAWFSKSDSAQDVAALAIEREFAQ